MGINVLAYELKRDFLMASEVYVKPDRMTVWESVSQLLAALNAAKPPIQVRFPLAPGRPNQLPEVQKWPLPDVATANRITAPPRAQCGPRDFARGRTTNGIRGISARALLCLLGFLGSGRFLDRRVCGLGLFAVHVPARKGSPHPNNADSCVSNANSTLARPVFSKSFERRLP